MKLLWILCLLLAQSASYRASVENWRADREERLRSEDSWLTLTGLFWLKEGENTVGSESGCRVRLPEGFPAGAGAFLRKGQSVAWRPAGARPRSIRTDKNGAPDIVEIGRLKLSVIERGRQLGIRMKDPESPARRFFRGLDWFPINPAWNVKATFIPQARMVSLNVQAGDKQVMSSPGYAEWNWQGKKFRLTPVLEDDQLFFIFRDMTAGKSTYAAARYLYSDLPNGGYVYIDFNKAYNPPCVFTPYATCPLPPPENRLGIAVEAGEKMYAGH